MAKKEEKEREGRRVSCVFIQSYCSSVFFECSSFGITFYSNPGLRRPLLGRVAGRDG